MHDRLLKEPSCAWFADGSNGSLDGVADEKPTNMMNDSATDRTEPVDL